MLGSLLFDEPAVGDRLRGAVMASAEAVLLLTRRGAALPGRVEQMGVLGAISGPPR